MMLTAKVIVMAAALGAQAASLPVELVLSTPIKEEEPPYQFVQISVEPGATTKTVGDRQFDVVVVDQKYAVFVDPELYGRSSIEKVIAELERCRYHTLRKSTEPYFLKECPNLSTMLRIGQAEGELAAITEPKPKVRFKMVLVRGKERQEVLVPQEGIKLDSSSVNFTYNAEQLRTIPMEIPAFLPLYQAEVIFPGATTYKVRSALTSEAWQYVWDQRKSLDLRYRTALSRLAQVVVDSQVPTTLEQIIGKHVDDLTEDESRSLASLLHRSGYNIEQFAGWTFDGTVSEVSFEFMNMSQNGSQKRGAIVLPPRLW